MIKLIPQNAMGILQKVCYHKVDRSILLRTSIQCVYRSAVSHQLTFPRRSSFAAPVRALRQLQPMTLLFVQATGGLTSSLTNHNSAFQTIPAGAGNFVPLGNFIALLSTRGHRDFRETEVNAPTPTSWYIYLFSSVVQ